MKNKQNLPNLIKWFESLSLFKQLDIFDAMINESIFMLKDELLFPFRDFRDCIVELITEGEKKDLIIKRMTTAGLPAGKAKTMYDYCNLVSELVADSYFIQQVSLDCFKKAVAFMMEKIFLYNEFRFYSVSDFAKIGNFHSIDEAGQFLRFVRYHISQISGRALSPGTLVTQLEREFNLPEHLTQHLLMVLREHEAQLHQAFLVFAIEDLAELDNLDSMGGKLSRLSCIMALSELNFNFSEDDLDESASTRFQFPGLNLDDLIWDDDEIEDFDEDEDHWNDENDENEDDESNENDASNEHDENNRF